MIGKFALVSMVAAAATLPAPAFAAQPIAGRWTTVGGKAIVQITPCGATMCGRIDRILKPTPGRPDTDIKNPDTQLRGRPLVGLVLLSGFKQAGEHWKGTIYDPESGKSYSSKASRNADGTLKVQGCIAFICRTQIWTPAR
ncbi:MAG: DUF2147 domain-containing protein [Sphingobium sp.]